MPTEKTYRIRVEKTHTLTEEALRGLWQYHKEGPFSVRKAIDLARNLLNDNPEIEIQISEGLRMLEVDDIDQ
jgi:hypothetical protein